MILTMPYAPGIKLDDRVLSSLAAQDVAFEYHFKCCGKPYNEVKGNRKALLDNICISRNACLDVMRKIKFRDKEFVAVMNDTDCKHLYNDNIARGEAFLYNNPEYHIVALPVSDVPELEPAHILSGCWIFSKRFFELAPADLVFTHGDNGTLNHGGKCECWTMCDSIRAAGLKIRYLDNKKLIDNMHN